MAKFTKKPVTVEAITFQELMDHGRRVAPESINGGMPWSFTYTGHHISHENDTCYLIPTLEGTMKMGPGDMLITGVQGEIYPCKMDIFEATYGRVPIMADGSAADPEKFGVVAIDAFPVIDPGPDSLAREIQCVTDKGPRVTPADIEAEIVSEHFFSAADGARSSHLISSLHFNGVPIPESLALLTFCVLVLRNGAKAVGVNYGAIDQAQHNMEFARQEARAQAVDKVYELLGFRLRDELARPVLTDADAAADLAGTPRPS